jgi:hypothetical protein
MMDLLRPRRQSAEAPVAGIVCGCGSGYAELRRERAPDYFDQNTGAAQ